MNSVESILRMWNAGQLGANTAAYCLLDVLDAGNFGSVLPTLHHFIYVHLRERAEYCAKNPSAQFFGGECPLRGYEPHRVAAVAGWIAEHGPAREAAACARDLQELSGVWKLVAVREAAPRGIAEGPFLPVDQVPSVLLTLRADRTGLLYSAGESVDCFFRLDVRPQYPTLALTHQSGPRRGASLLQAYRFHKDRLRLYTRRPQDPPDEPLRALSWQPMTEYRRVGDAVDSQKT